MSKRTVVPALALLCLLSAGSARSAAAAVVRVDWDSRYPGYRTIQQGIDAALPGDRVEVAEGTYAENLRMKDGVGVYGGYLHVPHNPGAVTVVDGGGAGSVVAFDNCLSAATVLDGFTIRNGNAATGGGIRITGGSPTVSNSRVTGNRAQSGGGIAVVASAAVVTGCTVDNNAAAEGAGIFVAYGAPTLRRNTVAGNTATAGGGGILFRSSADPLVELNTITGNEAGTRGGGILGDDRSAGRIFSNRIHWNGAASEGGGIACLGGTAAKVSSNVLARNDAAAGGGILVEASAPAIVNNTLGANTAPAGGGIAVRSASPVVANNIVAFGSSGISVLDNGASLPVLSFNDLFGNAGGDYAGIARGFADFSADPAFIGGNPAAPAYDNGAIPDLRLKTASPCVNAGDNAPVPPGTTDIDGQPRIEEGVVDIGADEHDGVAPNTYLYLYGSTGDDGDFIGEVALNFYVGDLPGYGATGVASTVYRVDGGTWLPVPAEPLAVKVNGEGPHAVDFHSTDLAGNVQPVQTVAFTIDSYGPAVLSTSPANKATNVPVNQAVKVTYDENIFASQAFSQIVLGLKGKTIVPVACTASISGKVLTLTPAAPLAKGAVYTVTIPDLAIKDSTGLWANPYGFSFTTTRK